MSESKKTKYQIFSERLCNLGYVPDNFSLKQMAAQSFCMPENCSDRELIRTADFLSPLQSTIEKKISEMFCSERDEDTFE